MVPMKRGSLAVLLLLGGCVHQAQVKGLTSDPGARVDTATFSPVAGGDVVVDVQLGLDGPGPENPQILVRTQIPCRVGPVPPPAGFRMVYVTFNPTVRSTLTIKEGFITVHRCDDEVLDVSGGWYVEGIIPTALELPNQLPSTQIPISHVEINRVVATPAQTKATIR